MTHGLVWACDRWQLSLSADVSLGGVVAPADGAGATVSTSWAPSLSQVLSGFVLTVGRKGTQQRFVRLQIPALSVDSGPHYVGAGNGSVSGLFEIDGLKIHIGGGDPPLWRVSWSAMRLYAGPTEVWSTGSGSYSDPQTCGRIAPSGVPLLGIPASISASCEALTPSAPACSIPTSDQTIYADVGPHSVTATGGWRFRETPTSAWVEPPVDLSVESPPAPSGCACPIPTLAIPTATTTWDAQVSAAIGGTGGTSFSGYSRSCSATLVPSLPRSFELMTGKNYAALWVRGGFPRTAAVGSVTGHDCAGLNQPVADCSASSETEVHPAASELLSTVVWVDDPNNPGQRLPRPIEDVLAAPVKAPYTVSALSYTVGPWPSDCSVLREGRFPEVAQKANALPILRHQDDVACYVDTWANPHWAFFYWFPPPPADPNDPIQPWEWPVDGSRVASDAYWVPLRTQWLHHPALPEEEKRRSRTSLPSAPLFENGLRQEIARSYIAAPTTSWVGVSRFEVWQPSPPASVALDSSSSPAWSGQNCTLSFGSSVTVGYSGPGTRTVDLDLGRWGERPWMYPAWARLVGLYWPAAQVQSVKVSVVGADGRAETIHEGQSPPSSSLAIPAWAQDEYAGSWAQDYGLGVVADAPTDSQTDGDSAAHMASPELSSGWRLGSARSPAILRFEIVPAPPGTGSVSLQYPIFYRPSATAEPLFENGHQQAVVWPDGASWRFGQTVWLDPSTDLPRTTPTVSAGPGSAYGPSGGYRASALDLLCEARVRLEGKDRADGLQAQVEALWDSVERSGRPTYARAADELTVAWLHRSGPAPACVLSNTWREIPPLAALPRRTRNAALAETGEWAQRSYDWAFGPRILVCPSGFHPALKASANSGDVLSPIAPAIPGWDVRSHASALDNTEQGWGVWFGGRRLATVRPWHGWSAAPREVSVSARPAYAVSDPLLHLLLAHDGTQAKRSVTANAALPLNLPSLSSTAPNPTGGWSLAWRGRLAVLAVSDGTAVQVGVSGDLGENWTMTAIGTGKNPALVCRRDGTIRLYYTRSGTLYTRWTDGTMAVWSSEAPCGVSGLDDAPIDAAESVGPGGLWRVVLVGTVGGELRQWTSTDGEAFA